MQAATPSRWLRETVALLACAVVLRTTTLILAGYGDYFPANFQATFLLGRQDYFYGPYAAAFYAHIVAGPVCLLLGLALLVGTRRGRISAWHRAAGKLQAGLVLLALCPSGLVMAAWAPGPVSQAGFAALAIATAACVALGWRSAVRRRFADHRRWMERTYALLASAVVTRAIGGFAEVMAIDGLYPITAWAGWLTPLAVLEAARLATAPVHSAAASSP